MGVLAGQILTADILNSFGSDRQSYTPVLTSTGTNPTLGSGSSTDGEWSQLGPMIFGWFTINFGTSGVGAGTGTYLVSLPADAAHPVGLACGTGKLSDNSDATASGLQIAEVEIHDQSPAKLAFIAEGARAVTSASPWTWAASDSISGFFAYFKA